MTWHFGRVGDGSSLGCPTLCPAFTQAGNAWCSWAFMLNFIGTLASSDEKSSGQRCTKQDRFGWVVQILVKIYQLSLFLRLMKK